MINNVKKGFLAASAITSSYPRFSKLFGYILSLCIVAFGQPARMPWLCPIAATLGFALFFSVFQPSIRMKERFWVATTWFLGVQLLQLSWMTSIEYQGYYILFVYFFICCALGLQFGVLAALLPQHLTFFHIAALSALWTILEWSRLHFICGFSWNPIGLALSFHAVPLQWASLFGVFGLSFWVMLVNLWALKIWRASQNRGRNCLVWGLFAILPYLFGSLHLYYHTGRMHLTENSLSVALIQTGLLPSEKVRMSSRQENYIPPHVQWQHILESLQEKQRQDAKGIIPSKKWDLIILPEAAVPKQSDHAFFPFLQARQIFSKIYGPAAAAYFPEMAHPFAEKKVLYNHENMQVSNLFWAQSIAKLYGSDIVIGLDHYEQSQNKFYNSAFFLSSKEHPVQRYDKRVLLPLAEYLPFEWMRPWTKSYGIYDFFSKGEKPCPLQGNRRMSVSICYEETFSEVIRKQCSQSDLLINLTNDGYYPRSLLPEQHFTHARLRTVENGRPLLRSCNTGVTAVIDSLGRIIARFGKKGEEFKRGVLECAFVPYTYQTPYSFWGDAGIISICFCLVVPFIFKNFIATGSGKVNI